jgi:DNA-nicking Smr family endonuclease
MREKNIEASHYIFNLKNTNNDINVIDFHGLTISEAKEFFSTGIEKWINSQKKKSRLKIITGVGNHSSSGSILGPAMTKLVKKRGWKIEEGVGFFWTWPG